MHALLSKSPDRVSHSGPRSPAILQLYRMLQADRVPLDVWEYIVEAVEGQSHTLAACMRVCKSLHDITAPYLYKDIVVNCHAAFERNWSALDTLNKRPHLRIYVRAFTHQVFSGFNEQRLYADGKALPSWAKSLASLPNLRAYTLEAFHQAGPIPTSFLKLVVDALGLCSQLRHVHWNFHVEDKHFAIVKQVAEIESVAFHRPSRAIITRIGPWIKSNPTIQSLSIKETRGFEQDLFDGINRSLALTQLQRLELGRGHEFSSGELLRLLQGIPNLEYLNIFYDGFRTISRETTEDTPADAVGLTRLQSLIVRHQWVGSSADLASLQSWMTIVAGESPLHTLTIVADDEREIKWHKKPDFFCSWPLLETLDIRYMHLAYERFSRILKQCKHLKSVVLRMAPRNLAGYSRGIMDHDLEVMCGPPDRRVRYPLSTYLTRKYKSESHRSSAVRFIINRK